MSWQEQRPTDPQQQHGFDLIGASIRRRRLAIGWTQQLLEVYSGLDQTVISRLENGKQHSLRWWRFAELVDALDGLDFGPAIGGGGYGTASRITRVDLDADDDRGQPDLADEDQEFASASR